MKFNFSKLIAKKTDINRTVKMHKKIITDILDELKVIKKQNKEIEKMFFASTGILKLLEEVYNPREQLMQAKNKINKGIDSLKKDFSDNLDLVKDVINEYKTVITKIDDELKISNNTLHRLTKNYAPPQLRPSKRESTVYMMLLSKLRYILKDKSLDLDELIGDEFFISGKDSDRNAIAFVKVIELIDIPKFDSDVYPTIYISLIQYLFKPKSDKIDDKDQLIGDLSPCFLSMSTKRPNGISDIPKPYKCNSMGEISNILSYYGAKLSISIFPSKNGLDEKKIEKRMENSHIRFLDNPAYLKYIPGGCKVTLPLQKLEDADYNLDSKFHLNKKEEIRITYSIMVDIGILMGLLKKSDLEAVSYTIDLESSIKLVDLEYKGIGKEPADGSPRKGDIILTFMFTSKEPANSQIATEKDYERGLNKLKIDLNPKPVEEDELNELDLAFKNL